MKKKTIPLWAIITVLALLIVGIFYSYNSFYLRKAKVISSYVENFQEYDESDVKEIILSSINHKVVIAPSVDDKIRISYFQKADNMNVSTFENKTIKIDLIERVENLDSLLFKTEKKIDVITIYLPATSTLKLNIKTIYGSLSIKNLTLDSVVYSCTTGDIFVENVSFKTLTLSANTSNISLDTILFNKADVKCVEGAITLKYPLSLNECKSIINSIYGQLLINGESLFIIDEEGQQQQVNYYKSDDQLTYQYQMNMQLMRGDINIFSNEVVDEESPQQQ